MSAPRTPALRRGDPRSLPQMIVDYLAAHGATMARDLARDLGTSHELMRVRLARLKHQKRVRIGGWIRTEERGRLYPRALWAAGSGQDASRPPALEDGEYNARRHRRLHSAVSSVFALADQVARRTQCNDWRLLGATRPQKTSQ